MNHTLESLGHLCRICLQTVEEFVFLFSDNEESKEILNKIYLCTQTLLTPDKGLPIDICSSCLEELNNAYNFRNKCSTIDERFLAYCKQSEDNIKVLPPDEISTSLFNDDSQYSPDEEVPKIEVKVEEKLADSENDSESTFKCDICTKVLKSVMSLVKHKQLMHEKRKYAGRVTGFGVNRRFHCTSCTYSTPHSKTLNNHMRRHDGDRPYICECGKSFTQAASLAAHHKTHNSTTYFTCYECGKQFKFAYALKTHQSVHENGKYSCHICHKVLKQRRTLAAHMQRHYNICNYSCEDCGSTFVTLPELINHRKKHNLDKNIECQICGYKTNAKKNLIQHMRRHGGEKPYKCNLCDTSCFTTTALKLHHRKHTREKPYSCPACAQRFAHSSSLNKHMQTLHGITYKWNDVKLKEKAKHKLFATKCFESIDQSIS